VNQIRPTTAHIDTQRLRNNVDVLRRRLAEHVKLLAPVKGDAYGHGLVRVGEALADRVDFFGVALVEEGKALRAAGLNVPVLCLGGVGHDGAEDALHHGLTPMVFDLESAERLDAAARRRGRVADIHLKVDTGMGRLGVPSQDWERFLDRLADHRWLRVEGICTHFCAADDDETFTLEQARRFDRALDAARMRAFEPQLVHLANSAAMLRFEQLHRDMVRPGLALYGISPLSHPIEGLQPVMRVTTQVLFVKNLPRGAKVGYGRTWTAPRPTRLATLPVGYADGYPRALSGRGEVMVHGQRCPVRGRVCMDLVMVDVTDVPRTVQPGDEVELLGDGVTAAHLASMAGSIPYEILAGFSERVPRR